MSLFFQPNNDNFKFRSSAGIELKSLLFLTIYFICPERQRQTTPSQWANKALPLESLSQSQNYLLLLQRQWHFQLRLIWSAKSFYVMRKMKVNFASSSVAPKFWVQKIWQQHVPRSVRGQEAYVQATAAGNCGLANNWTDLCCCCKTLGWS